MNIASPTTYRTAVQRGDYDMYGGKLSGKYDNVRIYWEDQLTRLTLRPALTELIAKRRRQGKQLRILDLGSGTGQGYELLTKIDQHQLGLARFHQRVLQSEDVELYLGLDLDEAMVTRGSELFADVEEIRFAQADLRAGLGPDVATEPAFDIYFSAYGSLSHLETPTLAQLLGEIYSHAAPGSLVVLDLVGRNSPEWPQYWSPRSDADCWQPYSMSYLHTENGDAPEAEIEWFPLRFWDGNELEAFVCQIANQQGVALKVLTKFDRSILVGRHVDTGEYNANLRPLRRAVNQLHEDYMRTDFTDLYFKRSTLPAHPNPQVEQFFDELINSWNLLVDYCQARMTTNRSLVELADWSSFSPALQFALMTMDRVIASADALWYGDPRANVIEPQLGYALRSLERELQQGLGAGHGLLMILQVGHEVGSA